MTTAEEFLAAARETGHEVDEDVLPGIRHDIEHGDVHKCDACERMWPATLLDGKPVDSDFDTVEGPCCYGPGWLPL